MFFKFFWLDKKYLDCNIPNQNYYLHQSNFYYTPDHIYIPFITDKKIDLQHFNFNNTININANHNYINWLWLFESGRTDQKLLP